LCLDESSFFWGLVVSGPENRALPNHPKVKGLSPAPAAGTGRENGENARTGIFLFNEMSFQNQTWGAGERGTGVRLVRPITAVILVSTF